MRLYRGLTKDGEEMIGDLVHSSSGRTAIIPSIEINPKAPWKKLVLQSVVEVIPSSVGQQIDKLDINRKEIYSGDIVKWENSVYAKIYEVREISGGWEIASLPKSEDEPRTTFALTEFHQPLEVIGNVHQHPDLLEKNNGS